MINNTVRLLPSFRPVQERTQRSVAPGLVCEWDRHSSRCGSTKRRQMMKSSFALVVKTALVRQGPQRGDPLYNYSLSPENKMSLYTRGSEYQARGRQTPATDSRDVHAIGTKKLLQACGDRYEIFGHWASGGRNQGLDSGITRCRYHLRRALRTHGNATAGGGDQPGEGGGWLMDYQHERHNYYYTPHGIHHIARAVDYPHSGRPRPVAKGGECPTGIYLGR